MTADAADKPVAKARCPVCARPTEASFRPFCSRRCADVDLSRWLGGKYAIPVVNDDADEDGVADPAPLGRRDDDRD